MVSAYVKHGAYVTQSQRPDFFLAYEYTLFTLIYTTLTAAYSRGYENLNHLAV